VADYAFTHPVPTGPWSECKSAEFCDCRHPGLNQIVQPKAPVWVPVFLECLVRHSPTAIGRRGPYDGSSPAYAVKAIAQSLKNSANPGPIAIAGWC